MWYAIILFNSSRVHCVLFLLYSFCCVQIMWLYTSLFYLYFQYMVYFEIYWLHVVLEIDLFAQEDALFDMFRLKLCFVQAQRAMSNPC